MDLICVEPQLRKKWSKILDAFGALAFAIAPLHSTFIQQIDGVGCHPCRKWYAVPPQYPQNADGLLRNDQAFCTELQGELKTALFGMCTNNPTVTGGPSPRSRYATPPPPPPTPPGPPGPLSYQGSMATSHT